MSSSKNDKPKPKFVGYGYYYSPDKPKIYEGHVEVARPVSLPIRERAGVPPRKDLFKFRSMRSRVAKSKRRSRRSRVAKSKRRSRVAKSKRRSRSRPETKYEKFRKAEMKKSIYKDLTYREKTKTIAALWQIAKNKKTLKKRICNYLC